MKHAIMQLFVISLLLPFEANAQMTLPTFECVLTDKLNNYDWPGKRIETFNQSTPVIYFICQSDNAFRGDKIKAVWIADHVDAHMPAFSTIAVKTSRYNKHINGTEIFEANLSLEKPACGWPLGVYHIQTYINGIESYSYKFEVR